MAHINKNTQKQRVRWELELAILKTIRDFKSEREPEYKKLKVSDVINALANIIARQTDAQELVGRNNGTDT